MMTTHKQLEENIKKLLEKYPCPEEGEDIVSIENRSRIRTRFYEIERANVLAHTKEATADSSYFLVDADKCIRDIVDKHFRLEKEQK